MKCRSQVLPLWKNPAANGPWYQVESNPVIPVSSSATSRDAGGLQVRASASSADNREVARAVLSGRGRPQRAAAVGPSRAEPASRAATPTTPTSQPDTAPARTGRSSRELGGPDQQRQREDRGRQVRRGAGSSGSSRRRAPRPRARRSPRGRAICDDAQQVARGRACEHLAAAQQADDLRRARRSAAALPRRRRRGRRAPGRRRARRSGRRGRARGRRRGRPRRRS